MKTKTFIMLITSFILFQMSVYAQKGYADKVNQLNSNGQKEGLWIDRDTQNDKCYSYYKNGVQNGVNWCVDKAKNLISSFGEYSNGEHSGTWYYFGDYGHLMMIQKDFQPNTYETPLEHHAQGICPYRCYCIEYYPNGNKESEGILLWDISPQSDFTFEYGEWKYYNEDGTLKETKVFK